MIDEINNQSNQYVYTNLELDLIKNINNMDLLDILKSNTLSFDFVLNYVLNEKYQKTRKEKAITIDTVVNYQPHLRLIIENIINNQ